MPPERCKCGDCDLPATIDAEGGIGTDWCGRCWHGTANTDGAVCPHRSVQ